MNRDGGDTLQHQATVLRIELHGHLEHHAAPAAIGSERLIGGIVGTGATTGIEGLNLVRGRAPEGRLPWLKLQLNLDVDGFIPACSTRPRPCDANGIPHRSFNGIARDRDTVDLEGNGLGHGQRGQPPRGVKTNSKVDVRSFNLGFNHENVHQRDGGFKGGVLIFAAPEEFELGIGGGHTEQHRLCRKFNFNVGRAARGEGFHVNVETQCPGTLSKERGPGFGFCAEAFGTNANGGRCVDVNSRSV